MPISLSGPAPRADGDVEKAPPREESAAGAKKKRRPEELAAESKGRYLHQEAYEPISGCLRETYKRRPFALDPRVAASRLSRAKLRDDTETTTDYHIAD
jgi:hypothetical protein